MNLLLALALGAFGCKRLGTARGLSQQADPAGGRFRARRCGRHRGPCDERRIRQGARPAGGRREQAGRRLEHRRGASSPSRRPDGYTLLIASPSSISVNPALNPKLATSRRDLVARHQDDDLAAGAGGQSSHRHPLGDRIDRRREEGSRQAQLLHVGQRLGAAPGRGAFQRS